MHGILCWRVVAVAQLVEPRVVIPVVAGSSPVRHLRAGRATLEERIVALPARCLLHASRDPEGARPRAMSGLYDR